MFTNSYTKPSSIILCGIKYRIMSVTWNTPRKFKTISPTFNIGPECLEISNANLSLYALLDSGFKEKSKDSKLVAIFYDWKIISFTC